MFGYLPSYSTNTVFYPPRFKRSYQKRSEKQRVMFYVGQFAQFTLRAFWLVLCIPRSDDAPACQVALSNARGACLPPPINRNADSIASSVLTKFVSGKAKTLPA